MCDHNIVIEGYCSKCKLLVSGLYDESESLILRKIDIFSKVSGIIDDEIISQARQICRENNLRNDKKSAFQSLYAAHLRLGYSVSDIDIAKSLGLKRKEYNKCITEITGTSLSSNRTMEESVSVVIKLPVSSMKELLNGIIEEDSNDYKNLIQICEEIYEDNGEKIFSYQPQIIAYTVLYLYFNCKKQRIPKTEKRCTKKQIDLFKDFCKKYIHINEKTKTSVVKIKKLKDGQVNYDVYIGRRFNLYGWDLEESKWGNPFKVKECGSIDACLEKYKQYILDSPELMKELPSLEGKILGCWCKPKKCHGDVLIELVKNEYVKNKTN